ncbi:hypothetical protein AB3S75_020581 [Citrus x aurantiifolia]
MATLNAPAHFSTSPCTYSTIPRYLSPNCTTKTNRSQRVRCALSPSNWRESRRRLVSFSLALSQLLFLPNTDNATAGSLWDKYVKKKKLDPLEVYIPPVILTQLQIKDLEKTLDVDKPEYANCRSLLRSGPAASLRVNIRAVAQYASDAGNGKTASDDVDQCLRALEDLDSLFLRASRNEGKTSIKTMKAKIDTALNALDSLLQTVPADVLTKGKAVADAYRSADDDTEAQVSDPEIKQLESIL